MKRTTLFLLLMACWSLLLATAPIKTGHSPTGFTENKGQLRDQSGNPNPAVLFSKDFGGMKVQLRRDGFSYELYRVKPKWVDPATIPYKIVTYAENGDTSVTWPGQAEAMKNLMYHYQRVDVNLTGANLNLKILTEDSTGGTTGYLSPAKKGNNIEVAGFSRIRYNNVYPGIDMVCHANPAGGGFKYDFIVHPDGNPDNIQLEYRGSRQLVLNSQGELEINTGEGVIKENIPLSWYQDSNGEKEMVNVSYILEGNVLKFNAKERKNQILYIDPSANIYWATYYGGVSDESGTCLAIDSHQNIYMGGYTSSVTNIATSGSYADSITLPYDGFIAKFTNDGQRLWGTYLGGFSPNDMAINAQNQFVVASDSGIMKFSEAGLLLWTYIRPHFGKAIACDNVGNVLALGDSLIKLNPDGNLIWVNDYADSSRLNDVGCDSLGNIYIAGHTTDTTGISTPGAHQVNYGGGTNAWQGHGIGDFQDASSYGDGFLLKLDPNGIKNWGSYCGGERFDEITSIAVHPDGDLSVSGLTNSLLNISTPGSFQPVLSRNRFIIFFQFTIGFGNPDTTVVCFNVGDTCVLKWFTPPYSEFYQDRDAFVAGFTSDGQRKWGTYFGSSGSDYSSKVILDKQKNTYLSALNQYWLNSVLDAVWLDTTYVPPRWVSAYHPVGYGLLNTQYSFFHQDPALQQSYGAMVINNHYHRGPGVKQAKIGCKARVKQS